MRRILDIVKNDLLQLMRERQTFLFLLLMPVAFTLLFSFAFNGNQSKSVDSKIPAAYLDLDQGQFSAELGNMFKTAATFAVFPQPDLTVDELTLKVDNGEFTAAVVIPSGYSDAALAGEPLAVQLIGDPSKIYTVESEIKMISSRLLNAVQAGRIVSQTAGTGEDGLKTAFSQALSGWETPPIRLSENTPDNQESSQGITPAQSSPGMMLQFALAGLLTSAQMIVNERKARVLQRMLTTATARIHILMGHYLSIFVLIFTQFILLIVFGQLVLGLNYFSQLLSTILMALTAALCIAAIGLLIGILAKTDDQAIMFSLIPMFILSGLGGAWMPLEMAGKTFQAIGHVSPVAWGMDGFKSILISGHGLNGVWLPGMALLGYAVLFFTLAAWRFYARPD
jgi:ABC-2 type transport system permease protein